MKKIKNNQLCQAFDPIMILPEKAKNITDPMKMSTSCIAPAYVYIEGSRGKRFLCDYHYIFEKDITMTRTPELWPEICRIIVEDIDLIKETFSPLGNNQKISEDKNCWCNKKAYVMVTHKKYNGIQYFCNFHYRKTYYRYLTNGIKFENEYEITDERKRMVMSVSQEYASLTLI